VKIQWLKIETELSILDKKIATLSDTDEDKGRRKELEDQKKSLEDSREKLLGPRERSILEKDYMRKQREQGVPEGAGEDTRRSIEREKRIQQVRELLEMRRAALKGKVTTG
jgi:hypothetical protein